MTPRGERARDALALAALKLALGAWVIHAGFTHVSDDDYARTAIAEGFAHAPRLDPSGTSWLPFPFWVEGTAMMVGGRSLGVARAVALALGAAAVAAPYLAMRGAGMKRVAALIAAALAMAVPYGAWLGAATVPEGWTGAITAAALFAIAPGGTPDPPHARGEWPSRDDRARFAGAALLLAASLSRYEAWPACAAFAAICLLQARQRPPRTRAIACALVAAAGPVVWMAWNAYAHGSPTHFVTRVTTFRHAVGAADVPLADKLLGYPRSLLLDTPEAAVLAVAGLLGLSLDPALRARWMGAACAGGAVVAFLVAGDLGDGAPTHHPARALSAVWWIAAAIGVDAARAFLARTQGRSRVGAVGLATALVAAWLVALPGRLRAAPGETDAERRDAQIARGLAMRARDVASAEITPCAFEHFALLAAWGTPERATLKARTNEPVTDACPRVEER
jgi:hypothetical protein